MVVEALLVSTKGEEDIYESMLNILSLEPDAEDRCQALVSRNDPRTNTLKESRAIRTVSSSSTKKVSP